MRRFATGALLALCLPLYACDEPSMVGPTQDDGSVALSSSKGPKGGGKDWPPPGGTVFFRGRLDGATSSMSYSMDAGGGAVQPFPANVTGIPSREMHEGKRWFLHVETVTGTYSDGVARQEVFATGAEPNNPITLTVQLTNDPDVHPREESPWWSPGDAKIGFRGRRLDAAGHVTAGGLFVLDMSWGSGSPAAVGSPVLAVPSAIGSAGEGCVVGSGEVCEYSQLVGFDWSPGMDHIVYGDGLSGTVRIHGGIDLAAGVRPRWSPPVEPDFTDGRIIFNGDNNSLWTVDPEGQSLQKVVSVRDSRDIARRVTNPYWSPAGEHFVYRWLQFKNTPRFTLEARVYRVKADGSGRVCLTCDDFDFAQPAGWW